MLPEALTNGLHNLRRLDEFHLSGHWCRFGNLSTHAKLPYHELGSPAMRSWDPFACYPWVITGDLVRIATIADKKCIIT